MPIRITCPSCSATLSVKDEFAGRAVKCPKCGGVIPASKPAAPAAPAAASPPPPPSKTSPAMTPPPPPAPAATEKLPLEELDEPAKPAKTGSKITGKPVARSKDADDDDDRPRRKNRDDDDDRDKSKKGSRAETDDDDRPAKRRRDADDDGDDRPRRGKKPKGKSGGGLVIGIVGLLLLTCCGGLGYGGWWLYNRGKEVVEKVKDSIENSNPRVNSGNFGQLKVGTDTRAQVEARLGNGRLATTGDLNKVYTNEPAAKRKAAWAEKVAEGRAFIWRNNDDFLLAAFHPNADGRLQMKEWLARTSTGGDAEDGTLDDAQFLLRYPGGGGDDLNGPAIEVTAEDLAKAFRDNEGMADGKYKDKVVLVEGKFTNIDLFGDLMVVRLAGLPPGPGHPAGTIVSCGMQKSEVNKVWDTARGQTIKIRGKCGGLVGELVRIDNCKIESKGTDPSEQLSAPRLIAAYAKNPEATDEKYKEKAVTISDARVESKKGESVYLIGPGKAKSMVKIKATWPFDFRKQIENLKPGDIIKIRGEYSGSFEGVINIDSAWLVP